MLKIDLKFKQARNHSKINDNSYDPYGNRL